MANTRNAFKGMTKEEMRRELEELVFDLTRPDAEEVWRTSMTGVGRLSNFERKHLARMVVNRFTMLE